MKIGIIGGSGLYELDNLQNIEPVEVETPFGSPSDSYMHGIIGDRDIYFLPRHARGHKLLPSEINHKANIFGFKKLGVECVLSVSAVGSLRENLHPRDIVLPNQYYDRTKKSLEHTFFGNGIVGHVAFGNPSCDVLREVIAKSANEEISSTSDGRCPQVNVGGTYVNMEGPAFSTRAESNAYRSMGFDIIGMTSLPEAKLCREAEICYQAMAMITDYDCWHESEEDVNVEMLIGHLSANTKRAKSILKILIPKIPEKRTCVCGTALATALMTDKQTIPADRLKAMKPIIGKYMQ